jgi:Mlc titration factor MtfA (ptsG expression regulator)
VLFSWLRTRRRRRLLATPLPAEDRARLEALRFHAAATTDERARLEAVGRIFAAERTWEPCGGFVMTPWVRLLIGVQAARLVLGRPEVEEPFDRVSSILVYPDAYVGGVDGRDAMGIVSEGAPRAGEAWHFGPIVLTWSAVEREARAPEDGQNVVLHELCHRLDMDDGLADGTPSLPGRGAVRAWAEVMTRELEALRDATARGAKTLLGAYAATNPTEFFAVATERFFERPRALRAARPELYALLAAHYRQDPAERLPT